MKMIGMDLLIELEMIKMMIKYVIALLYINLTKYIITVMSVSNNMTDNTGEDVERGNGSATGMSNVNKFLFEFVFDFL